MTIPADIFCTIGLWSDAHRSHAPRHPKPYGEHERQDRYRKHKPDVFACIADRILPADPGCIDSHCRKKHEKLLDYYQRDDARSRDDRPTTFCGGPSPSVAAGALALRWGNR
jgi:hypothetical protein